MRNYLKQKIDFKIKEIGKREWENLWPNFNDHNLQQSWEYGEAKCESSKFQSIHFVIIDQNKSPISLVQIFFISWGFLGGFARLNRGPLIKYKDNLFNPIIFFKVIICILNEAIRRKWWILFLSPELKKDYFQIKEIKNLPILYRRRTSYASLRISLERSDVEIMNSFKSKWRNLLRKSIKSKLIIEEWNKNKEIIVDLIEKYEKMQKEKKFKGISSKFIKKLSTKSSDSWSFNLYTAKVFSKETQDYVDIGILLSIVHGDTATYTLGITNSQGRKHNANYFLLWHAILEAKSKGCLWFDLGGLNKNTPKGIAHFKKGTNGIPYELIGEGFFINYPRFN